MEARGQHRSGPLVEAWFLTGFWGLMIKLAGQRALGVYPTLLSLFLTTSMHYWTRLFTWVLGSELGCLYLCGKC